VCTRCQLSDAPGSERHRIGPVAELSFSDAAFGTISGHLVDSPEQFCPNHAAPFGRAELGIEPIADAQFDARHGAVSGTRARLAPAYRVET